MIDEKIVRELVEALTENRGIPFDTKVVQRAS
jgi:hypothetical protein